MTYMDEKDLSTFHGEDTGKNFHCRFVWTEDLINTDVKLTLSEPSCGGICICWYTIQV